MTARTGRSIIFEAVGISHRFGLRRVLHQVSFECRQGESLCITGPNGSGKSTLLKIAAGVLRSTAGTMKLTIEGDEIDGERFRHSVRLVSPEMELYSELSGVENLAFLSRIGGSQIAQSSISNLLDRVGLGGRGNDLYGEYSSGMKQRLKIAAALLGEPAVVMLDEPTANLDDAGRDNVHTIMREIRNERALLFATNESSERQYGDSIVELG